MAEIQKVAGILEDMGDFLRNRFVLKNKIKRMKIAHILWSMGTGGTENMVVDIASVQAENNDVCIFVINDWVEEYMLRKPKCEVEL